MEVDDAVTSIMEAVAKDRDRVIMPRSAAAAYALRLLPTRAADFLLDQLGISNSMDNFSGHGIPAKDVKDKK